MSRKKNRNRSQDASFDSSSKDGRDSIVSDEISVDESSQPNQPDNSPNKTGIFTYLKTHWWAVGLIALFCLSALGTGLKYLDDNAKQTIADRNASTPLNPAEETLLSKINPLVPAVSPSPTPQLSKEYIYAGSRLLAVEDANANVAPPADLAIWRPSSGAWWVMGGQGSSQVTQSWGSSGDKPVPGDYDGDGKTDFAIFRPDATNQVGNWYLLYSATNSWTAIQWGRHDDIDNLTPADFDGDGKADVAVWRQSNSTFYSINSSNQAAQIISFSQTSTEPVSADYDGDGKADYAVRNSTNWIIRSSMAGNAVTQTTWQSGSDKAVHNDYDGDGKVDIAVWRAAESSPGANDVGNWYIRKSSNNQLRQESWGIINDIPVPAFYRR